MARPSVIPASALRLTWRLPFLGEPCGLVEVPPSRVAIAEAIGRVLPRLTVEPQRLTFVPLGDGRRTQVNVHGFGPFGVLEANPAD